MNASTVFVLVIVLYYSTIFAPASIIYSMCRYITSKDVHLGVLNAYFEANCHIKCSLNFDFQIYMYNSTILYYVYVP